MTSRILRADTDRTAWARFLEAQPLPITVSFTKGARRSLPQNATAAMWYSQIAAETGQTAIQVKAECKLRFGLLIMERDNLGWVAKWAPLYSPLPYAAKLLLFERTPLTSQLTTKQMAEYMDGVQKTYRAQGIQLSDPEAKRYETEFGRA